MQVCVGGVYTYVHVAVFLKPDSIVHQYFLLTPNGQSWLLLKLLTIRQKGKDAFLTLAPECNDFSPLSGIINSCNMVSPPLLSQV